MHNIDKSVVQEFLERQIRDWDTAKNNYEALKHVKVKEFELNGSTVKVQFNPARIVSSAAKVDAKSLKERKCFLCEANRPAVQEGLPWEDYTILVNPFPIFPKHLTIPANEHTPQLIAGRVSDMMKIARVLESYVVFYNGPKCGASAPDHMHFQAGNVGFMPVARWIAKAHLRSVLRVGDARLSVVDNVPQSCFLIESASVDSGSRLFKRLYDALTVPEGETEPMLNILCSYESGIWNMAVFPRKKHRPDCYFEEGDGNILISPASVDMGGVFITPLEKDFEKITASDIQNIYDEVCIGRDEVEAICSKIN